MSCRFQYYCLLLQKTVWYILENVKLLGFSSLLDFFSSHTDHWQKPVLCYRLSNQVLFDDSTITLISIRYSPDTVASEWISGGYQTRLVMPVSSYVCNWAPNTYWVVKLFSPCVLSSTIQCTLESMPQISMCSFLVMFDFPDSFFQDV